MIENEIIKLCITIRKKKLDRAQIQILKYRNMHEAHSALVKDAKKIWKNTSTVYQAHKTNFFLQYKEKTWTILT